MVLSSARDDKACLDGEAGSERMCFCGMMKAGLACPSARDGMCRNESAYQYGSSVELDEIGSGMSRWNCQKWSVS